MNISDSGDNNKKIFNVIFVLGPPGSGKGTQCSLIEKNFDYVHLSAGDLLRKERERSESKIGKIIETHIQNGSIVPVEITCKLLENAMMEKKNAKGFLIDGFPRNQNNLDGWHKEMNNKAKILFVLYITIPLQVCINRCLNRNQGRSDDNKESIEKRIDTYNTLTLPIIEYYSKLNLVRQIDGNKSKEEVYASIKDVFECASN